MEILYPCLRWRLLLPTGTRNPLVLQFICRNLAQFCAGQSGNRLGPQLALLETTYLHYYTRSYNHYADTDVNSVCPKSTAKLIKQARAKLPNTRLVDNDDTIQGSVLCT